jgi:hypothetical protein
MTLAATVHEPARRAGRARPGTGATRPTRGRRPAGPTLLVSLRLTLGDAQDPVAALADLVERLGGREAPPSAPVWLAQLEHAAVQSTPEGAVPLGPESAGGRELILLRPRGRTVSRGGQSVQLCRREFDLLLHLARNPGQVFTRGQLLSSVWGHTFTGERTVDVHVTRVRKKLESGRRLITTVRGIGYRLAEDAPLSIVDF